MNWLFGSGDRVVGARFHTPRCRWCRCRPPGPGTCPPTGRKRWNESPHVQAKVVARAADVGDPVCGPHNVVAHVEERPALRDAVGGLPVAAAQLQCLELRGRAVRVIGAQGDPVGVEIGVEDLGPRAGRRDHVRARSRSRPEPGRPPAPRRRPASGSDEACAYVLPACESCQSLHLAPPQRYESGLARR